MEIIIKEYTPVFKNQILELFEKTFHRELKSDFWNWRIENNPFGNPIALVAFFRERLIAYYMMHPIILQSKMTKINALFSMTTMTDPEFSGMGIMSKLASKAYDIGREKGYKLVFGFANNNSRQMFINKLGFKELAQMDELGFNIETKSNLSDNCNKITNFDESYSEFYNDASMLLPTIGIPRTSNYLNWRFISHPENPYICYSMQKRKKLLGYFVLKNYQEIKCHIVDFFLQDDDPDVFNSMINQSFSYCRYKDIKKITLWVNKTTKLYAFLKNMGFSEEKMNTYFIVKQLSDLDIDINDFNNWHITMSDSDVY